MPPYLTIEREVLALSPRFLSTKRIKSIIQLSQVVGVKELKELWS
jgi:hypothetical protein